MNKYLIKFRNGFEVTILAKKLTITYSKIDGSLEGYKFEGIDKYSYIPRYLDIREILAIIESEDIK